jgi:hypothetical protein
VSHAPQNAAAAACRAARQLRPAVVIDRHKSHLFFFASTKHHPTRRQTSAPLATTHAFARPNSRCLKAQRGQMRRAASTAMPPPPRLLLLLLLVLQLLLVHHQTVAAAAAALLPTNPAPFAMPVAERFVPLTLTKEGLHYTVPVNVHITQVVCCCCCCCWCVVCFVLPLLRLLLYFALVLRYSEC